MAGVWGGNDGWMLGHQLQEPENQGRWMGWGCKVDVGGEGQSHGAKVRGEGQR